MEQQRLVFTLRNSPGFVSQPDPRETSGLAATTVGLSFENMSVGDDTVASLPDLPALRCLDLDSTRITDRALSRIASLPRLEELWLEDTAVTDLGLRELRCAAKLVFVSVAHTSVTKEGIADLRQHLPGVEVAS